MEQTTPQKTNSQHQKALLENQSHNAEATETTSTYNTRENAISASKSAFVPTNSTSRVSAKKFDSVNPKKSPHQRINQPLKRCQFWIFTTLVNTKIESQYDNLNFELLPRNLAI
ncbi:hypothetical protein [Vibrio cholerae]|uniref:hypothetical protein n=1 Tax=Vibrio cholerae TaxID=666 RepID=UPI0013C2ED6A|nr:hypothetical protein [Vibrio cholerae]